MENLILDRYFKKLADKVTQEVGVVEGEPDIKIEGRSPKPSLRWEERCNETEELHKMNKPPVEVQPGRDTSVSDVRQYSNSAPRFDYENYRQAAEGTGYVDKRDGVGEANKAGVGGAMIAGSEPNQKKIDDTADTKMVFPHHKSVKEAAKKVTANILWASITNDCRVVVGAYREYCTAAEMIAEASMTRSAADLPQVAPQIRQGPRPGREVYPTETNLMSNELDDESSGILASGYKKFMDILKNRKLTPQQKYQSVQKSLTPDEKGLMSHQYQKDFSAQMSEWKNGKDNPNPLSILNTSPPAVSVDKPVVSQPQAKVVDTPVAPKRNDKLDNRTKINIPQSAMPFSTWLERQRGYAPSGEKEHKINKPMSSSELKMLRDVAISSIGGRGMEVDGSVFAKGGIMSGNKYSGLIEKAGKYLDVRQDPKTNKFYLTIADDGADKNMRVVEKLLMGGTHGEGLFKDDARLKSAFDYRRENFVPEKKVDPKETAIQEELGPDGIGATKPYHGPGKPDTPLGVKQKPLTESDYEDFAGVKKPEEKPPVIEREIGGRTDDYNLFGGLGKDEIVSPKAYSGPGVGKNEPASTRDPVDYSDFDKKEQSDEEPVTPTGDQDMIFKGIIQLLLEELK